MSAALKATAEALAGFSGRSSELWQRRAYEAVRNEGPVAGLIDRMQSYLEDRLKVANEREALSIRIQAFRTDPGVPDDQTDPWRERIRQAGGLTQEHVQELGYTDLADFRRQAGRPAGPIRR